MRRKTQCSFQRDILATTNSHNNKISRALAGTTFQPEKTWDHPNSDKEFAERKRTNIFAYPDTSLRPAWAPRRCAKPLSANVHPVLSFVVDVDNQQRNSAAVSDYCTVDRAST